MNIFSNQIANAYGNTFLVNYHLINNLQSLTNNKATDMQNENKNKQRGIPTSVIINPNTYFDLTPPLKYIDLYKISQPDTK